VMLALRCAKYNRTFERAFQIYKQRAMGSREIPTP
jgi:hypothetical protein